MPQDLPIMSDDSNDTAKFPNELGDIVKEESTHLESTLTSINAQLIETKERLIREAIRSRELTSDYVATKRAEDKQLLSSDEAVSHALREKHSNSEKNLQKIKNKPYFARFILEDETGDKIKTLEYKIGTIANLETRIIDWRKAPLAKLYYQYREGEEYSEDIQGHERFGTVKLKRRVGIEKGELNSISTSSHNFIKKNSTWQIDSSKKVRQSNESYKSLPDILSLITGDQYRMITEEADSPVLIQGVAGSGKTAVGLHRLSWLIHEGKYTEISQEEIFILVKSPVLKKYIQNSLPALQIEGVKVFTFKEWLDQGSHPQYQYIGAMIDEVQDFSLSELKEIFSKVKDTKSLTLVGDSAQELTEFQVFSGWEAILGLVNQGDVAGRFFSLEVSHRSTLPILNLARYVREESHLKQGRAGRAPIWFKCSNEAQSLKTAIDWMHKSIEKYPGGLTALLCKDREEAENIYSYLKPEFQDSISLLNHDDFAIDDGLIVAPIYEVKGLEFTNVVLWNLSKQKFSTSRLDRNLLYVGITRAEENVCIITWGHSSPCLPSFTGNLVRGYDFSTEE